ncbi:MAG: formate dehydrogenase iron-sulfur subunit [Acidimicrobiia bacterium]|jgi:formate dehydrogenase iron-sulfur subunit|nr:formate dehydrogenase iron-sulfur subunit [Acidimicrobiia bacterium]
MTATRATSSAVDLVDDHAAVPRVGFFTDTSICIGCKACEVACKEWNHVPHRQPAWSGKSYDNTGKLGADTWRHVAFIEQRRASGPDQVELAEVPHGAGTSEGDARLVTPEVAAWLETPDRSSSPPVVDPADLRWLMSSDVCKHCTRAACLEVCPTGALFRTEFGTVVVQADVCNGCGYCVPACPFGVIDQRKDDGRAWKCTLCYDRLKGDMTPACAQACPTQSIQFGELAELRGRAHHRLEQLQGAGVAGAQLYGADENDGVGGMAAFFLLLDRPEVYGLPPDPVVTTRDLPSMWRAAAGAAAALVGAVALAAIGGKK